ncbi:MAG: ParB N-terminal domain-containing protein [Planctomycetes bacterium]|nr:ParB N-terminal domain-containing protein [Planctomycetota bacterium]
MQVRDRIVEFIRVPARSLRPNPRNWRTHPPAQQDALRGLLAEVGYAEALVARRLNDGELELIDGHLRAETTPDMDVPVLVVDVSDAEADKLLATLDPLAAQAGADEALLTELLSRVETEHDAVRQLLDSLLKDSDTAAPTEQSAPPDVNIDALFQVVAECRDEADQKSLFERLQAEGYQCRLLML